MTIEADLYARLYSDAGVSAITTRIYPARVPDAITLPFIRYQRVSSDRPSTMGVDAGLVGAGYQIDCWATDQIDQITLRNAIRLALQRWRGTGTVTIQDTFITDEDDMGWEEPLQAYRGRIDILIWAEE